jgi:integrase
MAQITGRLTPWKIKTLTAPGRYADGGNLYVVVRDSGSKSFSFLYRWDGKPTEAGGGGCDAVSLKQARSWAAEGRGMLHESPPRNPKVVWQERKRAAQVPTFAQMAQEYVAGKARQWRSPRHRAEIAAQFQRDCKLIADKPVDAITTADVVRTIRALEQRAPVMATRLRGRIEQVLAAAQVLGHIDSDKRNPAAGRGHLSQVLSKPPPITHFRALPYCELPAVVAALRALRRDAPGAYCLPAYALEFLILTATRSGEARGARWDEIDLSERLWSLPAKRMKAHRPHQVPPSDGAMAILDVMRELRSGDLVFPGRNLHKPPSDKAFERLLRRLQCDCTAHGFRSSFRDWAGNETAFDRDTCEAALAHLVGTETERAYRRAHPLEKHRALLQAWDRYLACEAADVIALRA